MERLNFKWHVLVIMAFSPFVLNAQSGEGLAAGYNNDDNIENHPNVLYATQFDNSNWEDVDFPDCADGYSYTNNPLYQPIYDNSVSFINGGGAFKFRQYKDEGWPEQWTIVLPENKRNHKELYMRWYQLFEGDYKWEHQKGMRLGGKTNLNEFPGCNNIGGDSYMTWGTNFWPEGSEVSAQNYSAVAYYYNDNGQSCGSSSGTQFNVSKSQWQCFEVYIKLNDVGSSNGEGKIWVNGALKLHEQNIRFRKHGGLDLNFIGFHGGNGNRPAPQDQNHWVDNLVVATSYIGPIGSGGGSTCGTPINWSNTSMGTQTGTFTAEWDMTPDSSPMEGAVGLSDGTASAWGDLATIVRFNTSGNIDVRNGGGYSAQTALSYSANTTYHIRQVVDINAHTYSVYVTPAGGSEITLATNYSFRTESQSVTQLTHRAIKTITCSLSVSNLTTSGGGDPGGGSLEGTYYLKNRDSGKRMKAKNSTAGQLLELGSATGTGSNFEFTITEVSGDAGYYFITVNGLGIRNNDCNDPSGTYVETHNGTGDCVRWEIIENGAHYNLRNKDSGLYARNDDCNDEDGNEIELSTGTGNCAQWTLEPVSGSSSARIGDPSLDSDTLSDLVDGISIYPNPSRNSLTISGKANFNYHFLDLSGRLILSGYKNTPAVRIDLSNIKPGMYLLQYNNGSNDFIKRIVVK